MRFLRPSEVAEQLGVDLSTIYKLARSGELAATDVSLRPGTGRPSLRFAEADIEAFVSARRLGPPPKQQTRRRQAGEVTEYF